MTQVTSQFIGNIPEHYDKGLGPVIFVDCAEEMARRAAATGAMNVLEIAAGTGIVSRKLRDALSADAHLIVTDLNSPMLEIAQTKFRAGERIELRQADAMALPFASCEFDLVVCQFGVMFFPDKISSFREAARVLRPGGLYIFNTWGSMAANPHSQVSYEVAAKFLTVDPPQYGKVPYSYHDAKAVKVDLQAAGWSDVQHDMFTLGKCVADLPGYADGVVFGTPLIGEIQRRGNIDPKEVVEAIISELQIRFGPEPITIPLQANVFTCKVTE